MSLVGCAPGGPVSVDKAALQRALVSGTPASAPPDVAQRRPVDEIPDHLLNPEIAAHKEAAS